MQIHKQYLLGDSQSTLLSTDLGAAFLPLISQPLSSLFAVRTAGSCSTLCTVGVCSPSISACAQLLAGEPEGQSHSEAPRPASWEGWTPRRLLIVSHPP